MLCFPNAFFPGDWLHSNLSHLADASSSAASHFFGLEFGRRQRQRQQQQQQQQSLVLPDGNDLS